MKTVYMCMSTEIIHGGHIKIIQEAAKLGRVIVGVLADDAVASYRACPLLSYEERSEIINNVKGVSETVKQSTLSYAENLYKYRPDYVVHGDKWKRGVLKPIRAEVIHIMSEIGGELIEFPNTENKNYTLLEQQARNQLSVPDIRRGKLRRLLDIKKTITIMEAHNGITGLIVEKTVELVDDSYCQFDGMWVSSLCDSTSKGKPDIELVDMSSRLRTIDEIMEVTKKPIILDGDTGGLTEHFVYNIRTLERIGVSAIIIEDKIGLKQNSLFGTDVEQHQDSIENFCNKIRAGKMAQKTSEFMIIARIESLILEIGMKDALERAFAYCDAGADGIMIHSRKSEPDEVIEFMDRFREKDDSTPLVVVPTTYNETYEKELSKHGANIIIYANHLIRSGFLAMQNTAKIILRNHRAKEAEALCMPIKSIINLIPKE